MKILIVGDFCPRYRVEEYIEKGEYSFLLSDIKELTKKSDYSVANFECPVVEHEATPIKNKMFV